MLLNVAELSVCHVCDNYRQFRMAGATEHEKQLNPPSSSSTPPSLCILDRAYTCWCVDNIPSRYAFLSLRTRFTTHCCCLGLEEVHLQQLQQQQQQ